MSTKLLVVSCLLLLVNLTASAQPKPKSKQPSQADMNKMMEDAMKAEGMSKEEQAEMKKMMGDVMPELMKSNSKTAYYPEFTNNTELIPKKEIAKINAIPKKKLTQADITGYAANLYNKLLAKGNAAEMAIVKKVIAQSPNAGDISGAAILAMQQGHPQAAMALSIKAVQLKPANPSYQNNMASLLTQYGYAEQALPVLQKLRNDFPKNSTVMNNLAHAWLGLGEIDSANAIIKMAGGLNPYHPESKDTEGVIEETNGDPEKAAENYESSMENALNPFTEQLIKNNKSSKSGKLDYEKLKRSITIYEYFPKDWIKIPALSDNVSGYEKDRQIQNGYEKMFDDLEAKIKLLQEASENEVNALMDKGDDVFAKEMMKESIKGINMMSKPAVIVQLVLQNYMAEWMPQYVQEYQVLLNTIKAKKEQITKSGKDDKCPDYDRKNNEFLSYANPLIREFHTRKIEEFRIWLNTFCTWIWYLTGNPKNTMMSQCIGWTNAIAEFYKSAIADQRALARTCVEQNGDGIDPVSTPEIPNFSCPTLIKMPMGSDWQDLSNAAQNFDNNKYAIKKTDIPVPNHTVGYGVNPASIAEPGRDPFVKSANGSMTPGMATDDELTPLSKIPLDELTPLPKLPNENDPVPLPDLRKSKLAKELLKKMMSSDCKNVRNSKDILKEQLERMMKGVKELEAYENVIEEIKRLENEIAQKEADGQKREQLKKQMERIQQEVDKMDKYEQVQQSKKEIEKIIKEMEAMDDKKMMKEKFAKIMESVDEMEAAPAILKGIQQNGLQSSISSGLQAPGTFTPQKGLFN
ncbi:hypothetical protein CAP36_03140 [Chitinophagaceae bacterium IBVUCB2]|nr:hypothetical protein CAP36_03140 [Chitinophagaceae bacterium IBVUCB2]